MSAETLPLRLKIREPTLKDLLDQWKRDIFLGLNCHAIGTVQTFDNGQREDGSNVAPTLTAAINYKRSIYKKIKGVNTLQLESYPVLVSCPVFFAGGGGGRLTFPIAQGDQCLIAFNDRDLNNWLSGNPNQSVASTRLHAFGDGIALVGLYSNNNPLPDFDDTRALLKKGSAMVGVGNGDKVLISNGTTLNNLLQQLITAINEITVPVAGIQTGMSAVTSGTPINATTLTTIATAIGELLE